jgi:hypothetical protein
MEAKLHAKLIEELKDKIEGYLNARGYSDYDIKSVHLGNWIADFSQAISEGFKAKVYKGYVLGHQGHLYAFRDLLERCLRFMEDEEVVLNLAQLNDVFDLFPSSFKEYRLDEIYGLLADEGVLPPEAQLFQNLDKRLRSELQLALALVEEIIGDAIETSDALGARLAEKPFDSLDEARQDVALQCIENGFTNLIKVVGFFNFKVGDSEGVSAVDYDRITDQLLTPSRPSHHLDRDFAYDDVRKAPSAEAVETAPHRYLVDDYVSKAGRRWCERLDGENPFQALIDSLGSTAAETEDAGDQELPANDDLFSILGLKSNECVGLYNYIKEYLFTACGSLSATEDFLRQARPEITSPEELNLELAKLGKTLHIFEDFYSHSNFIEFGILSLHHLYKSGQYKSFKEKELIEALFQKKGKDRFTFTNLEMNKVVRSLVKMADEPGELDSRIATGFFGGDDLFVSLYHAVVIGSLEKISDLDDEYSWLQNVEKKTRSDLDKFTIELAKGLMTTEQVKARIKALKQEKEDAGQRVRAELNLDATAEHSLEKEREYYFEKKMAEDLLDDQIKLYGDYLKEQERYTNFRRNFQWSHLNPFDEPPEYLTDQEVCDLLGDADPSSPAVRYLKRAINYFILARDITNVAKHGKDVVTSFRRIYQVITLIKTLVRIVSLLLRYPKAWLRLVKLVAKKLLGFLPERLMVNEYALELLEHAAIRMVESLRDRTSLKKTEFNTGSHSLIAKDEAYEKPKLNEIAMKMAAYVDGVIIKNLFEYDSDDRYKEWYTLVPLYFHCYAPLGGATLPEHRVEPNRIQDFNQKLDLSQVEHRRQHVLNQQVSQHLERKNTDPYNEQCIVDSGDTPQPLQAKVPDARQQAEPDPGLTTLFIYELILKRERGIGNVELPAGWTREQALRFSESAGQILAELDTQFLHAAIHLNFLAD